MPPTAEDSPASAPSSRALWRSPAAWIVSAFLLILLSMIIIPNLLPSCVLATCMKIRREQMKLAKAIDQYYATHQSLPVWIAPERWPRQAGAPKRTPPYGPASNYPTFAPSTQNQPLSLTAPQSYIDAIPIEHGGEWPDFPMRYYAPGNDPELAGLELPPIWIVWSMGPDWRYQIDLPLLRTLATARPHRLTEEGLGAVTYRVSADPARSGDLWIIGEAGKPPIESNFRSR